MQVQRRGLGDGADEAERAKTRRRERAHSQILLVFAAHAITLAQLYCTAQRLPEILERRQVSGQKGTQLRLQQGSS